MSRGWQELSVLLLLLVASGASCPRAKVPAPLAPPVVFHEPATMASIIGQINNNTQRVAQLQTNDAKLTVPGLPALRSSLALERPRRFRLQAGTGLTGTELDIGSNDELFWMWAKRNEPPSVFYARHDQFTYASASGILPVPPDWLMEAMGLVLLDPSGNYQGPVARNPGQLEFQTTVHTSYGVLKKVFLVDDQAGLILAQHVFDQSGTLLASATSTDYTYEPLNQVALPRRVEIQLPTAELAFTLEVDSYVVNQLSSDPAQLWSLPQLQGYPYTDLVQLAAAAISRRY